MNFSSSFGVLLGVGVMYLALSSITGNINFFLDYHAILIVIGGTTAAASISYPLIKVLSLLKVFILRVLGRNKVDFKGVISQLIELNKKASVGITAINEYIPQIKHDFLKEAVTLVGSGILTEKEIKTTLEQRVNTTEARYMFEANMFKNIGRFPPAFGLLATTLGMISLLQKIGQPDSQKMIGPAMSIGLIGTLYGIALANLVFLPIAENLTERTQEEMRLRKMIIEGAVMLKAQVNPIAMREGLNSFLLPKDRVLRKAA
ncbi:MAG: MotA/TolQ/ExbB proton channel family protein [Deltaproteobacteria bacterium]|nr:MotA/TolQ/ExbB proton channel family protein [Deltaproteobacteria bacterium]